MWIGINSRFGEKMSARESFQVLHICTSDVNTAFKELTNEDNLREWIKRNLEILRGVSADFAQAYEENDLAIFDEFTFFTEEMTDRSVNFDIVHPYETYSPYAMIHLDTPKDCSVTYWDYFKFI